MPGVPANLDALLVGIALLSATAPIQVCQAADYALMVGVQADAAEHGVLNAAVRHKDWQFSLYTETLDVRWTTEEERGKSWLGARFAGGASGLMISPWVGGRLAAERALLSGYAGLEYGSQRYLSRGFYAGVEGHSRLYGFGALQTTTVPVPEPRPVLNGDLVLGWYKPFASAKLRPGVDLAPSSPTAVFQPHVILEGQVAPDWTVAPRAELRAAWVEGQDDVTRTRVGGLNPYVVPVAGAVWAEWWVEDYVAVRAGPQVSPGAFQFALLSDVAWFDGQTEMGFALNAHAQKKRFYTDLDVGFAPWIPRPDEDARVSVWFALGLDWGTFKKPSTE